MDAPAGPVVRECVEGYLFAEPPLELLLFRRPPSRDRVWVPISGKVEPTDADYESALRRELFEETALSRPNELFPLDWHVRFRVDSGETWRLHAYGVRVDRSFAPVLSPEHEASRWVTPQEATRLLHYEDNRTAVGRLVARRSTPPPPGG
jgi:8-oxo-dGTP pyrophosphatase MutT (NUDIX family)